MLFSCVGTTNRSKSGCVRENNERGESSGVIFLRKHLKKGWDY